MKIVINYELIDKVREAKTGFSVRKYSKAVGSCTCLAAPIWAVDNIVGDKPPLEFLGNTVFLLLYYFGYFWFSQKVREGIIKKRALDELRMLSYKLKDIYVHTDPELLQDVDCYKTEYSLNFDDSILPKIEQKKYITVPVHSEWDNRTRFLVQEHIVGTKEYTLSHGEVEEKKIYSLSMKKMISK